MIVDATGNLFLQLGLIVIIAAFAAIILRLFRQPQILAYVLVGVFIAPILKLISNSSLIKSISLIEPVLRIVTDTTLIQSMSVIGIAFLLFIVGLEMDLKILRNVAFVSSMGGLIQIILVSVLGYLVSLLLGFLSLEAAYIGLMLAFSSTMVVMKLLSDKRELQTLHGRIVIGTLLVQDVVAILALSVLTSIDGFSAALFGIAFLKFLSLFALTYLSSKFIFPYIFRFAAKNQELLLITSLAVCFIFSLAFYYLGFSIAIGAFIAGIALGNLEYNLEIIGKVKSLKDFFAMLFFVSLGMGLSLTVIMDYWLTIIILLLIVIIVKPVIIMGVCSLFKYTKKPAFLTANSLAQVGEFSLILAAQGLLLGHLSQELFSIAVIITIITIVLTSYYIQYSRKLYGILEKPLSIFDFYTTEGVEYLPSKLKPRIVLCGYNRIGYSILKGLDKIKKKLLIVDFNPEVISKLVKQGYHCIYGDATDGEIIDKMELKTVHIVISTIPFISDNILLIRKIKQENKKAEIIVTASEIDEALDLYGVGADYVVLPHFLGGEHVADLISKVRIKKIKLNEERSVHIEHLKKRKEACHEHPNIE